MNSGSSATARPASSVGINVNVGHPQRPDRRDGRTIARLVRKPPDIALSPVGIAPTGVGRETVWMLGTAIAREIRGRGDDEAPNGGQSLGDQCAGITTFSALRSGGIFWQQNTASDYTRVDKPPTINHLAKRPTAYAALASPVLASITFAEAALVPIGIWRGLSCSGISRTRSTWSKPLAKVAALTST
jgi:hypothetical protein